MASKLVVDRERSADKVAAVEAHADEAAKNLEALLSPHLLKKEKMPDVALLFQLCARRLNASKDAMIAADDAHEAELGDDKEPRERRDDAAVELQTRLVQMREVLTGLFGGKVTNGILSGATPEEPIALSRFAGSVASALKSATLPKSRVEGAVFDAHKTAKQILADQTVLETARKDVAREEKEAQATLGAKNRALATYDEAFAGVATAFSGLLQLAGLKDLAERVRPSQRRPGQTAEEAPAEGATTVATGSGSSSTT